MQQSILQSDHKPLKHQNNFVCTEQIIFANFRNVKWRHCFHVRGEQQACLKQAFGTHPTAMLRDT
jgi:hypothetical protein